MLLSSEIDPCILITYHIYMKNPLYATTPEALTGVTGMIAVLGGVGTIAMSAIEYANAQAAHTIEQYEASVAFADTLFTGGLIASASGFVVAGLSVFVMHRRETRDI